MPLAPSPRAEDRSRAQPELSVVIPAFNEGAGLPELFAQTRDRLAQSGATFEILIIDDGSTDNTWAVLRRLSAECAQLRAARFSRNFGKEAAISAGLDLASGAAVVIMDADLQHPPALLPEMIDLWRSGEWDVIEAVKRHRGRERLLHRVLARSFYHVARIVTGWDLQDRSDFKLLDRRVIRAWQQLGERETFFRGLVSWLGFRSTKVFFEVPERLHGTSRWTGWGLGGLAIHAVTSLSALPLQIVTALGALTLLIAVVVGVQAIRLWYQGTALPGFTTIILLQLILCGFLMLSLGIIGTYIGRIYEEVKGRPRYIIRDQISDSARDGA